MKVAQLPNGHVLSFPDEAQEPHMDAAVQAYMASRGDIPPAVDPVVEMFTTLQQGFAQALAQLSQSVQAQIGEMQKQNMQREQVFVTQLNEMRQQTDHTTQSIVRALTLPKKIVHDSDGRPVGVTVGN